MTGARLGRVQVLLGAATVIEFDIRTGVFVGALVSVLVGALLAFVRTSFPDSLAPPLRAWARGTLLQGAGFLLLSLRGVLPDLATIVLADTVIALALGDYLRALRRYSGRGDPRALVWAIAAAVAVLAWALRGEPAMAPRVAAVSLAYAGLCGLCLHALLRLERGQRSRALHVTAGVFALTGAFLIVRVLHDLLVPRPLSADFVPSAVEAIAFAVGASLPAVGTIGFLLMCTGRVRSALERAARFDFLTELCNRRAIHQSANAAIASAQRTGQPLAVAVIDVDHFKRINDALGHAAGDRALVQLSQRLRAAARSEDQVGRIGGEEFLMVLPRCDTEAARIAAERLREAIATQPLELEGRQWPVTVSIGVAVLRPGERDIDPLLQRADRALYAAKEAGRNRVEMAAGPVAA